ncbi:MAG: hypothetical protein ACYCZI_09560, partial [Metallibacterium scheffleri]
MGANDQGLATAGAMRTRLGGITRLRAYGTVRSALFRREHGMIARIAQTRTRSARITALLQCSDGGRIRSGLSQQSGSQNRSGTGICRRREA